MPSLSLVVGRRSGRSGIAAADRPGRLEPNSCRPGAGPLHATRVRRPSRRRCPGPFLRRSSLIALRQLVANAFFRVGDPTEPTPDTSPRSASARNRVSPQPPRASEVREGEDVSPRGGGRSAHHIGIPRLAFAISDRPSISRFGTPQARSGHPKRLRRSFPAPASRRCGRRRDTSTAPDSRIPFRRDFRARCRLRCAVEGKGRRPPSPTACSGCQREDGSEAGPTPSGD